MQVFQWTGHAPNKSVKYTLKTVENYLAQTILWNYVHLHQLQNNHQQSTDPAKWRTQYVWIASGRLNTMVRTFKNFLGYVEGLVGLNWYL